MTEDRDSAAPRPVPSPATIPDRRPHPAPGPASGQASGDAERVRTGLTHVDEVIAAIEQLEERPLEEHVGVFEAAHAELRRALDDLDNVGDNVGNNVGENADDDTRSSTPQGSV